MSAPLNTLCHRCRAPLRAEDIGYEQCAACDDQMAILDRDAELDRAELAEMACVGCDWPGCEVCE